MIKEEERNTREKDDGLWDNQIEEYMKSFKKYGWKGVYSINELNKIPVSKRMSFIMNLSPDYKAGTHWVAIYIDTTHDQAVEYYDSFGEDPPHRFLKDIKLIINKLVQLGQFKIYLAKIGPNQDRLVLFCFSKVIRF